jgi:hypothetical protein
MPFSTDPNKAEKRLKGTLDRTLTVNAGLTVNFYSGKQPREEQIRFLADALKIAKRAITEAIQVVADLKAVTKSKVEMNDGVYNALLYHYALAPLADRKDWTAWAGDLEKILGFFFADQTHLFTGPVVVGDTHRLVVKPEFAKVTNPQLQAKITSSGGAPEGFVNLKKPAWAEIDKNPQLFDEWTGGKHKFDSTQWGNIKVDFGKLCKVTRLQIAGTLIHETTHKMKNAVDHAYASDPGYSGLTKAERLDNADSHAFAAICLYKKALIRNDAHLTMLSTGTLDAET